MSVFFKPLPFIGKETIGNRKCRLLCLSRLSRFSFRANWHWYLRLNRVNLCLPRTASLKCRTGLESTFRLICTNFLWRYFPAHPSVTRPYWSWCICGVSQLAHPFDGAVVATRTSFWWCSYRSLVACSHVLLMVQPQEWQACTYPFDSAAMLPYSLSPTCTSTGMYSAQLPIGLVHESFVTCIQNLFWSLSHSSTGSTEGCTCTTDVWIRNVCQVLC